MERLAVEQAVKLGLESFDFSDATVFGFEVALVVVGVELSKGDEGTENEPGDKCDGGENGDHGRALDMALRTMRIASTLQGLP